MVTMSSSVSEPLKRRSPDAHVWQADLVRAMRPDLSPADRDTVARICGFAPRSRMPVPKETPRAVRPVRRAPKPTPIGEPTLHRPGWLRFSQPTEYARIETSSPELPQEIDAPAIGIEQLRAEAYRIKPQPLQSWSRLWPHLHRILGTMVPGRRIDLAHLVDDMAALRPVRSLPRRLHPAWAPRVHIRIDGTMAMDQFQPDIDVLLEQLRRIRGREGLHCWLLPFGPESLKHAVDIETWKNGPPPRPAPGEPVLAFSDLGCLDGDGRRTDAWMAYGMHLRQIRHATPHALAPCPRHRWTLPVTALWRCSAWETWPKPF